MKMSAKAVNKIMENLPLCKNWQGAIWSPILISPKPQLICMDFVNLLSAYFLKTGNGKKAM